LPGKRLVQIDKNHSIEFYFVTLSQATGTSGTDDPSLFEEWDKAELTVTLDPGTYIFDFWVHGWFEMRKP